jgi:hypothetical protein
MHPPPTNNISVGGYDQERIEMSSEKKKNGFRRVETI